ncbi:MAG: hypothetical protein AAGA85_06405 [Bacteroidota bacterium]
MPLSNYQFGMLNLSDDANADRQLEGIFERTDRYLSFPLIIKELSDQDKELLDTRITGEQPTTNP